MKEEMNMQQQNGEMQPKKPQGSTGAAWIGRGAVFLAVYVILSLAVVLTVVLSARIHADGAGPCVALMPSDGTQTVEAAAKIDEADVIVEREEYTFEFLADLSAYEMYMQPTGDEEDAYLFLVNRVNTLDADYAPEDLTDIANTRKDGRATQKMRLQAAKALEALFLEAAQHGITDVTVTSGYRTYAYQQYLFDTYIANEMKAHPSWSYDEARAYVETYSALPGTSEHQSGLCVDMHNLGSAQVRFEHEEAAKWLAENCHKFGFILRYPKDKVEVTGISFEPWHFRYVGRFHATKMQELEMCLEEYIPYFEKTYR